VALGFPTPRPAFCTMQHAISTVEVIRYRMTTCDMINNSVYKSRFGRGWQWPTLRYCSQETLTKILNISVGNQAEILTECLPSARTKHHRNWNLFGAPAVPLVHMSNKTFIKNEPEKYSVVKDDYFFKTAKLFGSLCVQLIGQYCEPSS